LPPATWQAIPDLPRQVNALAADPSDPQVLYAGSGSTGSGSGVYKSEDGGLTWRSVTNGLPSEDVVALAFSPDNPPTLYAAVGQHLYASADGAASWSQLAQYVGNSRGFERIAVAPSNGNVLYAVTVIEGTFRSDDAGYNWRPINAGLPQDSNESFNVQAVAVDPTNPDVVYAGTGWEPFNGNGVYKSTDGGETWQPANQGMMDRSVTALAIDPTNPQTVYAGTYEGELFRSADGGATWDDITPSQADASEIVAILLNPANSQSVYLLCSRTGVPMSADGGGRWQMLGKPGTIEYGEFSALAVIFGPQPTLIMGISGEGGWRYGNDQAVTAPTAAPGPSDDTGPVPTPLVGRWQAIPDLPSHVNALAVDPTNSQIVYAATGSAGSGSGIYKSQDGGLTWQLVSNGLPNEDAVALAFSHDNPPVLYTVLGSGAGELYATDDGAASWARIGNAGLLGFTTQLAVAPGNGSMLFIASDVRGGAHSFDGGANWIPFSEGLPQGEGGEVCAQSLAINPTDPNVVYLGTGCGPFGGNGVYKSTDGGETWSPANRGMMDYSITALAIDPTTPQTVYAGGNGGELYKSTDSGATWQDITPNLEQSTIVAIVIDPSASQVIYLLSADKGVLASYDEGARWRLLGKPAEIEYASFSTMVVLFGPQPVIVAGSGGEGGDGGGWRYAAE
jgi:photosystem II stability/assembly factor-like uncharacterized protein